MFTELGQEAPRQEDERGWLQVLYEEGEVVLKRSFSRAGVFRGMHAQQAPSLQRKLIRVESGRIVDFAFDFTATDPVLHFRPLAPADGWIAIPARAAHGFFAVEETVFDYVCHGAYDEAREGAWSIAAVLAETGVMPEPILSAKDRAAPAITLPFAPGLTDQELAAALNS
ncbi:MAG: dTDP-4-dehydrorhamnose 3,5-epimerase family protein [Erythrobacter sp.]|jgi:dTDP-4-dehydrorhamnose 3,5-epimerase|nr:dTDP-4-dehydrorhamnose 3,5-epimerase family protein [Erythrobacter sp.]